MRSWPKCDFGLGAILRDAWTPENVGRRFYGCQNFGNPRFCGYHEWYDAPTPPHLKETILEVRDDAKCAWRKLGDAEAEVEKLKKVVVDSEVQVQKLKEERDVLNELNYVEFLAKDASNELKVVKEEARDLRAEVKCLKQQRMWFVVTGFVLLTMYWLV